MREPKHKEIRTPVYPDNELESSLNLLEKRTHFLRDSQKSDFAEPEPKKPKISCDK
jgi:hypothetical protein